MSNKNQKGSVNKQVQFLDAPLGQDLEVIQEAVQKNAKAKPEVVAELKALVLKFIQAIKTSKANFLNLEIKNIQRELQKVLMSARQMPTQASAVVDPASVREVVQALVNASFKKFFSSRAVSKSLEPKEVPAGKIHTAQPSQYQSKLINEIFSSQITLLADLIQIFDRDTAIIDIKRQPSEKPVSSYIIDYFVAETVNNQKNRFCYLQHLALFHLLNQSAELRQVAKQSNLLGQLLRIMNQYMIQIHETQNNSDLILQLDDQSPLLFDLHSVPNINQIVIESYNKDHSDIDYEMLGQKTKKQNFNLNLKDFSAQYHTGDGILESGAISGQPQQYSNLDTAGTGIRNMMYRGGGPSTQSRRLTHIGQHDALMSSNLQSQERRKKYDSQSPVLRKNGDGSDNSRNHLTHPEHSHIGSQEESSRRPTGGTQEQSPALFMHNQNKTNSSGIKRKINQTAIQEMNWRQNIHKINQINKLSFVRAASEPPQPVSSGILNSKSIILPVEEEREDTRDAMRKKDHSDHLNQQITKQDLRNQQIRTQKFKTNLTNSQEINMSKGEQKKRSSSSFILSNFFNGPLLNQPIGSGGHPQLSALSSQHAELQGTPGPSDPGAAQIGAAGARQVGQGYQHFNIHPQQNSFAMTRLSRRQLSYGQNLSLRQQQTQKFQTASNQVIAAYGDPRDLRFSGAAQGKSASRQQSSGRKEEAKTPEQADGRHEDGSDDSAGVSEDQDTISHPEGLDTSKGPKIPKLNLVQINQDSKLNKNKLNSSLGHQNILGTAGGHGLLTTPGQHQKLIMQGPLTSHLPMITSTSPGKHGEGQVFHLDTSNRTSAIFPVPMLLASFTNAHGGHPVTSGGNQGDMSALLTDNGVNELDELEGLASAKMPSYQQARSFKQQKNNLLLRLQHQSTQNNSDINDNEIFHNNSMKILDGIPSGTLNLGNTQGTQASQLIGMNLENGAVHNIGGALITNQDGQILGNNSRTKMAEIATQLGEAFLSNDLGCLIAQQREMELEDQAKQMVLNQDKDELNQSPLDMHQAKRSKSVIVSNNMFLFKRKPNPQAEKKSEYTKPEKVQLTREIMFNILEVLLRDFSNTEMRIMNFNQPLQSIRAYLQSNFFQFARYNQSLKHIAGKPASNRGRIKIDTLGQQTEHAEAALCLKSEFAALMTILQKFSFANEDIMRKYISAQFANHIDKEKPNYEINKILLQQEKTSSGFVPQLNVSGLNIQKSPIKQNNHQLSYDSDAEEFFRLNRILAVTHDKREADPNSIFDELLTSPNQIFANNGIVYDITKSTKINGYQSSLGVHIPKDVIRRKLDILLYTTSQQIKNLIFKQTQEAQGLGPENAWINATFAQQLTKQVVVLSSYIEGQGQSRVLLNQLIDVALDSLLMIKRVLTDVTLKQNIFIIDSTKQIFPFIQQELLRKGVIIDNQLIIQDHVTSPNVSQQQFVEFNLNHEIQAQLAVNHMCYRHLFSEFLKLLSLIMKMPQSVDTLKLFNELFVGNANWQEVVKNYSISLWLQDVIGVVIVGFYHKCSQLANQSYETDRCPLTLDEKYVIHENLETLRGINILNWNEKFLFTQIDYISYQANMMINTKTETRIDLSSIAKKQMEFLMIQLVNMMTYYKTVPKFFKQAIDIFFPTFSAHQKDNSKSSGNMPHPMGGSFLNRSTTLNMPRNMQEGSSRNKHNGTADPFYNNPLNSYHQNSTFSGRIPHNDENMQIAKTVGSEQKYWKESVRKALYQMAFWITNTNGLLNQYLYINASNYKGQPMNLKLTQTALQFLKQIFNLNQKFTKYVFIEDILVFYIRTHHVSFVRLYNKSKKFLLDELNLTEKQSENKQNSFKMCKQHLKCLYAIAKNRNEDSRQKLFKFQIIPFLGQEINLENEYKATRKTFLSVSKKTAKEANEIDYFDIEEANSPTKKSSMNFQNELKDETEDFVVREQGYILDPLTKASTLINNQIEKRFQDSQQQAEMAKIEEIKNQKPEQYSSDSDTGLPPPIPVSKPKGLTLNLAVKGLGWSTVAQGENGKTAEQMADEQLYLEEKQKKQEPSAEGNGASDSDSDQGLPPPLPVAKPRGLGLNLAIKGLGMSTLSNNPSGMTAEQLADADIINSNKKRQMIRKKYESQNKLQDIKSETEIETHSNQSMKSIDQSQQLVHQDSASGSDSDMGLPPPLPVSRPKGLGLSLAIGGLGLSTLAKNDGGKTAEEMGDLLVLKENLENKKKALISPQSSSSGGGGNSSDSDAGLPPPLPLSKPKGLNLSLAIGGLGLSTLAKTEGGKTAEEMGDMQVLKQEIQQKASKLDSSSSGSEDSDAGLPPPMPVSRPVGMNLNLNIGGLGLSTLAKTDGGKTAEELGDMMTIKENMQRSKQQQDSTSSSDSDAGLPPPLPVRRPLGMDLKLPIGSLGLSTLAKNDGDKTAEQLGDEQTLKNVKKKPDDSSSASNGDSDSDEGLPPALPAKPPGLPGFQMPKLAIGGLGLSTLAKGEGGKTAEEQADMETYMKSKNAALKPARSSSSSSDSENAASNCEEKKNLLSAPNQSGNDSILKENFSRTDENSGLQVSNTSSDSDQGLPPPIPFSKPQGLALKLAIGGLGLSTLAKTDGGKTAEEMGDLEVLKASQQKKQASASSSSSGPASGSDSDEGLPPQLPMRPPGFPGFQLPKLAIGGLGLSTLAKVDGGKTAEEMADMETFIKSKQAASKPKGSSSSSSGSPSHSNSDHEEGRPNQQPGAQGRRAPANEDFDSDSSGGLPPPLPPSKPQGFSLGLGGSLVMPKLAVDGLGLSSIKKDGQTMTQEEMADRNQFLQSKQQNQKAQQEEDSEDEDLSSDEEYYRELEKIKSTGKSPSQYEGGSPSSTNSKKDEEENEKAGMQSKKAYNTIDQQQPQKIFEARNKGVDMTQPLYKLNIKTINKQSLKMHPNKLSNRDAEQVTPKMVSLGSKKQRYIINNPKQQVKIGKIKASDQKLPIKSQGGASFLQRVGVQKQRNETKNQFKTQSQPTGQRNNNPTNTDKKNNENSPSLLHPAQEDSHSNTHVGNDSIAFQLQSQSSSIMMNQSNQNRIAPNDSRLLEESLKNKMSRFGQNSALKKGGRNKEAEITNNGSHLNMVFESDEIGQQESKSCSDQRLGLNLNNPTKRRNELETKTQEQADSGMQNLLNVEPEPMNSKGFSRGKTFKLKKKKAIRISKDDFYEKERAKRPIYHDQELHSLMLSLLLCLLLQPERGTLDNLYCHQYPIDNGKQNILYMLHQHISHDQNQYIIEDLLEQMCQISPPLAGQRLLKLMCPQLFDLSLYNGGKDWRKLAVGAYGTVYECKTNLVQPSSVAIKQMDLPNDIYDRCVLHDIFTEITCLEEFRLEKCVTDLYDYGVDKTSYYIVMKKYACSLGEWRRKQGDSIEVFRQNLGLYVSIYNQVLKCLKTIHSHNVTHYDIKCDNILIDFIGDGEETDLRYLTEDDFQITVGDFGECKIFSNDKDEFCTRNRGTDSIKSPEMLQLAINTRKDHDKYDRRKQVGTNRLSDIWSVGCLFYELLTGEFLLYNPDFAWFFVSVVSDKLDLITEEKLQKIDNNQYIKDFLKFILIRDQRLRPTIDKVMKRFDHIHAIMVGQSSHNGHNNDPTANIEQIKSNVELNECLKQASQITEAEQTKELIPQPGGLTRIMESIFMCSRNFLSEARNIGLAIQSGITHVVVDRIANFDADLQNKFEILQNPDNLNSFKFLPQIMDFLRKMTLYRGRILFVENSNNNMIKDCILLALNHLFKTNTYETYNLIKSQNLFFKVQAESLAQISKWNMYAQKIRHYLMTFPQFSCHCGASLIILERQFSHYQNIHYLLACDCSAKLGGGASQDLSGLVAGSGNHYKTCPCAANPYLSCAEYLEFLSQYYSAGRASKGSHISLQPVNQREIQLLWAYFDPADFVLCPKASDFDKGIRHDTLEAGTSHRGELETKRSQQSSRRSNLVPKIPIAAIGSAPRSRMSLATPGGAMPPSGYASDRMTNRTNISKVNQYERQIAGNISQTVDVNSISVVTKKKIHNITKALGAAVGTSPAPGPFGASGGLGLNSATSLLSNTPEPISARLRGATINKKGGENAWDIKKCRICNCWTYAYNAYQNKYAVLLNNRIDVQKLNSQGLLNQRRSGNEVGITWNNLEFLKHQFWLMEQEYIKRCAAAPQGQKQAVAVPGARSTMFNQFQSNAGQLRNLVSQDDSRVDNASASAAAGGVDQQGVSVPVLKNICIQLPF